MKTENRCIFLGKLVKSTVIHGHPVPHHGHKKIEIKEILYSNWEKLGENIHAVGSYLTWATKSTELTRNKWKCVESTTNSK